VGGWVGKKREGSEIGEGVESNIDGWGADVGRRGRGLGQARYGFDAVGFRYPFGEEGGVGIYCTRRAGFGFNRNGRCDQSGPIGDC